MTSTRPTSDAPTPRERKTEIRKRAITEAVLDSGSATAQDLASRFGVSIVTIHRDLDELERRGVVRKFHGGVTAQPSGIFESQMSYRLTTMAAEKTAIAQLALQHVQPGMSILLDDSTTVLKMVDGLPGARPAARGHHLRGRAAPAERAGPRPRPDRDRGRGALRRGPRLLRRGADQRAGPRHPRGRGLHVHLGRLGHRHVPPGGADRRAQARDAQLRHQEVPARRPHQARPAGVAQDRRPDRARPDHHRRRCRPRRSSRPGRPPASSTP